MVYLDLSETLRKKETNLARNKQKERGREIKSGNEGKIKPK